MKIGKRTRLILEIVAMIGSDLVEGTVRLPVLYKSIGLTNDNDWVARIEELVRLGWLDRETSPEADDWVARLSDRAFEGLRDSLDPVSEWESVWNCRWTVFAFDLPSTATGSRQALRRWLRKRRFGRLQGSLWILHRELECAADQLSRIGVGPRQAVSFAGCLADVADPRSIVARAWNLDDVCRLYRDYLAFLEAETPGKDSLSDWFYREQAVWRAAFEADPFLPRQLWPDDFAKNYAGPEALERRRLAYVKIAEAATF